jgi:hypothetical protein
MSLLSLPFGAKICTFGNTIEPCAIEANKSINPVRLTRKHTLNILNSIFSPRIKANKKINSASKLACKFN